tara:strand:- start:19560 stop:20219 length:660 start_codon:yes stop_codon:yes gene_type:complete
MAKLEFLILHCTATREGHEVTKEDIHNWHIKRRGWKQVGYSEMIHLDGTIEELVPYNDDDVVDRWEVTNGARGMNFKSRHITYVGGVEARRRNGKYQAKDTRTEAQLKAMEMYVKAHTTLHPNWKIAGHYHFAAKACPSFDVPEWLESIGIQEKNIYRKEPRSPFSNKFEGDAFRLWVNAYYPEYAKSINLDKSGSYKNSFILKAYAKLGEKYEITGKS